MGVVIREERACDREGIAELLVAAFGRREEAELVARLRRDEDAVAGFVATDGEQIVGYALLSRLKAPLRALGLAPIAVRADRRHRGIARTLVEACLQEASASGYEAVFVLGDPCFYGRLGFDPALAAGFSSPYAGPHFMAHALGRTVAVTSGTVAYAAAFEEIPW